MGGKGLDDSRDYFGDLAPRGAVSFKGCAGVPKGVMKGGCEGGPRGVMKGVLERFRRVSEGVSEGFPKGFPRGFHGFPGVSARRLI